jgi:hypothetical protein
MTSLMPHNRKPTFDKEAVTHIRRLKEAQDRGTFSEEFEKIFGPPPQPSSPDKNDLKNKPPER